LEYCIGAANKRWKTAIHICLLFLNKEAQNSAQNSTAEGEEKCIWKLCWICSVIETVTRYLKSLIEKFMT